MVKFHCTHLKATTVHLARKATEVECIDQQNHMLTFILSSMISGSRIPPSPPPPPPPPVAVAPLAAGSQGWHALNWTVSEGE